MELILLTGITLAAMASPGPDMLILTRNGIAYGPSVGIATVIGICLALTIHLTLCVLGLAWLISQNAYIYDALRLLGALYLVYLGISALRSDGTICLTEHTGGQKKAIRQGVLDGFLCNLLNPKVTLFLFAVFTQFVSAEDSMGFRLVCGAVIIATSFIGWSVFVCLMQTSPVRAGVRRFSRVLDRVFGGLLIALGVRVAFSE